MTTYCKVRYFIGTDGCPDVVGPFLTADDAQVMIDRQFHDKRVYMGTTTFAPYENAASPEVTS